MKLIKTECKGVSKYQLKNGGFTFYGNFWYSAKQKSTRVKLGGKKEGITRAIDAYKLLLKVSEKANNRELLVMEDDEQKSIVINQSLTLDLLAEKYFQDRHIIVKQKYIKQFGKTIKVDIEHDTIFKAKRQSVVIEENRYKNHVKPHDIASMKISKIQIKDIEKYLAYLDTKGLGEKSYYLVFSMIKTIWNKAYASNYINIKNPFSNKIFSRDIKNPNNNRIRTLAHKEQALLLSELKKEKDYNAYYCAYLATITGARARTILGIRMRDIRIDRDKDKGTIHLNNYKTNKPYKLPIVKEAFPFFDELFDTHDFEPDEYIIQPKNKTRYSGTAMRNIPETYYKVCNRLFNNECDMQNPDDRINDVVNFHTLRHTFATDLIEADTEIYYVKQFLNHSSIKTTLRYVKENQDKMGDHLSSVLSRKF